MSDSFSGPHDVGGRPGFGTIDPYDDGAAFHHEWEARVFAINRALLGKGLYSLDEFRYAIERMEPDDYYRASYFERWLYAIERLVAEKNDARDV